MWLPHVDTVCIISFRSVSNMCSNILAWDCEINHIVVFQIYAVIIGRLTAEQKKGWFIFMLEIKFVIWPLHKRTLHAVTTAFLPTALKENNIQWLPVAPLKGRRHFSVLCFFFFKDGILVFFKEKAQKHEDWIQKASKSCWAFIVSCHEKSGNFPYIPSILIIHFHAHKLYETSNLHQLSTVFESLFQRCISCCLTFYLYVKRLIFECYTLLSTINKT